ncbi:MAG: phage Gp37/Gp68 family protein [Solobacterium sp.]|nr:phage Gp37/Gp68 family protein [Solobacterium sp.]
MPIWNPWHGCHKISAGCAHCYMYRRDAMFDKDSSIVTRTSSFDLPVQKKRDGSYKLQSDAPVYTCMTSDFFVEEADEYRKTAWEYIRIRSDLHFVIITKRIDRFTVSLPDDWGDGYENVTICSTCENQETADHRLPIMISLPLRHRHIIHEPMLGPVDIRRYLATGLFEHVTCGGESGDGARVCDYDWILDTRKQCLQYGVPFYFKQTGACFRKDGRIYHIERKYQLSQARKAGINTE